jgi:hypothetical protein
MTLGDSKRRRGRGSCYEPLRGPSPPPPVSPPFWPTSLGKDLVRSTARNLKLVFIVPLHNMLLFVNIVNHGRLKKHFLVTKTLT